MVVLKSLTESTILIIGNGPLVREIVSQLKTRDISKITILDSGSTSGADGVQILDQKPTEIAKQNPGFLLSFDLVLIADQPREVELLLSDLRWPDDLPMMVMRCVENNCKMRCQYRDLLLREGESAHFVSLPMDLLPWTEVKRKLVATTIEAGPGAQKSTDFRAYIASALALIEFEGKNKTWPISDQLDQVMALVKGPVNEPGVKSILEEMCQNGLSGAPETFTLLATLVTADAERLLTGSEQPVNNTNVQDAIKIVADSLL